LSRLRRLGPDAAGVADAAVIASFSPQA
jgi:hypothetical protein